MSYNGLKTYWPETGLWYSEIATKINNMLQGKLNVAGTFTLSASVTTTTVTVAPELISDTSVVLYTPTTANAASEVGAGGMYVSAKSGANNTFTLTHANSISADRTFDYVIIG